MKEQIPHASRPSIGRQLKSKLAGVDSLLSVIGATHSRI